jgi:hypothetical protein
MAESYCALLHRQASLPTRTDPEESGILMAFRQEGPRMAVWQKTRAQGRPTAVQPVDAKSLSWIRVGHSSDAAMSTGESLVSS